MRGRGRRKRKDLGVYRGFRRRGLGWDGRGTKGEDKDFRKENQCRMKERGKELWECAIGTGGEED